MVYEKLEFEFTRMRYFNPRAYGLEMVNYVCSKLRINKEM